MSEGRMPDPGSADHRQGCLSSLRHALQRVALDARDQMAQFPPFVAVADELALDLNHWTDVCRACEYVEGEIVEQLVEIDALLAGMGGPKQAERWTPEGLASDHGWQRARDMARNALRVAGWPQAVPPKPGAEGTTFVGGAKS
jgi:hypothetical protein